FAITSPTNSFTAALSISYVVTLPAIYREFSQPPWDVALFGQKWTHLVSLKTLKTSTQWRLKHKMRVLPLRKQPKHSHKEYFMCRHNLKPVIYEVSRSCVFRRNVAARCGKSNVMRGMKKKTNHLTR